MQSDATQSATIAASPWWHAREALTRFVADLVEAELQRLRPGRPPPAAPLAGSGGDCDLVADLGADSLEMMALSTALGATLQLAQAPALARLPTTPALAHWVDASARALDDAATARPALALTFQTSGSAGQPKPCAHSLATLWQEVAVLAALLPARRRIVSAVPSHHIYGFLFTQLLPQAGATVLPVLDVRGQAPAHTLAALVPGDLVIGHPDFWQAALGGGVGAGEHAAIAIAADVVGVSSTAPCPDALATALGAAGLARLLQVYGSSETGGVGWRDVAGAPYRPLPYWQRVADDEGVLLRTMADGSERTYRLQDRLAWSDDGGQARFLPAGRVDAAVQVGGVNVFPAQVAALLCRHPAVREAAVRRMRDDEGSRLKAFIVTDNVDSEHLLAATLDAWLRPQLAAVACPASYTFGSALPRQRSGKLADWIIDA